jgi:hypothetical protein
MPTQGYLIKKEGISLRNDEHSVAAGGEGRSEAGWMADWIEPFARTIDAAKKYVVSSTLERVDWNAELMSHVMERALWTLVHFHERRRQ